MPPSSIARAWGRLVLLIWQRQVRAPWLVWVSIGLLALSALLVYITTINNRWTMGHWRVPRRGPTLAQQLDLATALGQVPWSESARGLHFAALGAWTTLTFRTSGLAIFSTFIVFALFTTFLLPLWTLSFAAEALGREREGQTLIWMVVRPIPRPAIYVAAYIAVLPWCLGFNLGGLSLLCWLGGDPGRRALALYWPAALLGTLAFAALFHLFAATFRRAGVVALLYAFFLETVAGNMPGLFKRLSLSFYTRCLMFDAGSTFGIGPDRPWIFRPVDGATAAWVLALATVTLLAVGMVVFTRSEYLDVK
ncbi:MAG: ABC transporter permease [Gemmataceae bacterium]|nr:ABC transporter permease [Gemmataceae bacterium]